MVLFTEQPLHLSSPASLWVKELAIFQKRMHFRKMRTVLKKSLMLEKVAPEPMSGCATGFAMMEQTPAPADLPAVPNPWLTSAMHPYPKALNCILY